GIVVLTEGRYHQIKRMFGCYGAKVTELQRIAMGNLQLPADLEPGQTREFTEEELKQIREIIE
ncbi:MAG: 16S rRNA pseudouridine(516) synthase, partial [Firmicutes bacterium]|nr:16S rRNA pseudouridine(516) synthase [Bacillota bacterium]